MSPRCKSIPLPHGTRPPNQGYSFDQLQWFSDPERTLLTTDEPNCSSMRADTPKSETILSDSEDTTSNSQGNSELTWEQPPFANPLLASPQDCPYVDKDGTNYHPSLPFNPCYADIQMFRAVDPNSPRHPTLTEAYNVALQTEPRVVDTLTYLDPLVHNTTTEKSSYGKPRAPRTRIPNSVKDVVLYLHKAYFSVYPDATVKDIADRIACYLAEWG